MAKRQKSAPPKRSDGPPPKAPRLGFNIDEETRSVNTSVLAKVQDAYEKILGHSKFSDITTAAPQDLNMAAFDSKAYAKNMKDVGTSTSNINFWWASVMWTPQSGVPLNMKSIEHLMQTSYMKATPTNPEPLEICITDGEDPADPESHGHLRAT
eukprot:7921804-Pyramimonas_sp.AAC.1